MVAVLAAPNWLSAEPLTFPHKEPMNALQSELLGNLREAMVLLYKVEEEKNPEVSMSEFWKGKVVNAYGEEAMDFQGKSVVLGVLRISYATPPNT